MAYETSYDVGLKPFSHDKHRGKWASPKDFLFACIGHAFRVDAMFILPSLLIRDTGIYGFIPYTIIVLICTMPIVYMQTFLGQFSSTGFISVFRIAPIFKGVGYVSLAVNLVTLTYYSIFAAIPLFYIFHAMRPILPWSCDHEANWTPMKENGTTICHIVMNKTTLEDFIYLELPSQKFFTDHMNAPPLQRNDNSTYTYSWPLFACTIIIWVSAWAILRQPMKTVGRIIRYLTITMLVALSVCVLRLAFLPEAFRPTEFYITHKMHSDTIIVTPVIALAGLGPGWGSILTMASYNNFKTNITKYTWLLCLGHTGLMIVSGLAWIFIENFLFEYNNLNIPQDQTHWKQALAVPTVLSLIELPHFWSLLFFGMITLGALNLLIVQLFSVLTSVFDEYAPLRRVRREVIMIAAGGLCLISVLFCSNKGIFAFELLCKYSMLTQALLNLMLLLVVLWIYGRERFQRDVHFMTNRTYSTWMVNIVRFVAPIFLILTFLAGLIFILIDRSSDATFTIVSFAIVVPWLLIPGYFIYKLVQTSGQWTSRFKRCCRPTDWYPVDRDDRQRYDEMFSEADISHQLTTPEEGL